MEMLQAANPGFDTIITTPGPMARFVLSATVEVDSYH